MTSERAALLRNGFSLNGRNHGQASVRNEFVSGGVASFARRLKGVDPIDRDAADCLYVGDHFVALNVDIGGNVMCGAPAGVADTNADIVRGSADPQWSAKVIVLLQFPEAHVMPPRGVAEFLLEGEIL